MAKKKGTVGGLAAILIAIVGWGITQLSQPESTAPKQPPVTQVQSSTKQAPAEEVSADVKQLADLDYQNNSNPVRVVANNQSGLDPKQWAGPKIVYGNLDNLNRTTTNVGYLDRRTLIRSAGRPPQVWRPTGWHNQYVTQNGRRVNRQNRGHLIAYTLSGNLNQDGQYHQGDLGSSDNPKNLASQTEFANQVLMQPYEQQARDAIASGKRLIYRVTTVFRGDELMPRGYWLQALTTDRSLDFNVYLFNVQSGVRYDYKTGRSVIDRSVKVPTP